MSVEVDDEVEVEIASATCGGEHANAAVASPGHCFDERCLDLQALTAAREATHVVHHGILSWRYQQPQCPFEAEVFDHASGSSWAE